MADAPKKYVKINGVMKLNPEYKTWKDAQSGAGGAPPAPATTVVNSAQALPIVTNMDDYEQLNDSAQAAGDPEIPLSESTNATIGMMQEPEICVDAGMTPDTMVDELGAILNKYEVPMGLMNKLMMISEFDALEFIVDDSGSMTLQTDSVDPKNPGRKQTRWQEAQNRLKEMVEVLAYVPFQEIVVIFLNRRDRLSLKRNGRDPKTFLADAFQQIDRLFGQSPSGGTPAYEKLQESMAMGAGKSVSRYFFGDGIPNGGAPAQAAIVKLLMQRPNPEQNPMTFLSCTNEDEAVEWMKDAEEMAPYCAEFDDFSDEAAEVLRDQGPALPFSKGFWLVCTLVAASNPDDLDAMDESVPFTKATLDNLLGIEHNETSYKYYFDSFVQAQASRVVEKDSYGRPKKTDELKKNMNWQQHYTEFLRAPVAKQIPAVQTLKQQLVS